MDERNNDMNNTWTAKRKSTLVLDIWQGKITLAAASEANNLPPSAIEDWIEVAMQGMENALQGTQSDAPDSARRLQAIRRLENALQATPDELPQQDLLLTDLMERPRERIKIGVETRQLRVTSEPYPVLTTFGYAVAVAVLDMRTQQSHELLIGSKSLSTVISSLVEKNNNRFAGLEFRVKKESNQRMAKYVVETCDKSEGEW